MLDQLVLPPAAELVRLDADRVRWVRTGDALYGEIGEGEAGDVVEAEHGPRSSGGAFFDIPEDVKLLVST